MSVALSLLVTIAIPLGLLAAFGRASVPAAERVQLRRWRWRDLRSAVLLGWGEMRRVQAIGRRHTVL